MIVYTKLNAQDDLKFVIDYCETGSSLDIQTEVGNSLIRLDCIPPAILIRLRDSLSECIVKGARKSQVHKI